MNELPKFDFSTRRLVGLVAFAFLFTFVVTRLVVYLVLGHLMPDFFLTVRGVHIHHFTYGVVILVMVGFYLLVTHNNIKSRSLRAAALVYGMGLGLTFDEFGMWIMLRDDYWVRQSYDAIIVITLLFVNILLFPAIKGLFVREFKRMWNLGKRLLGKKIGE